MSSQGWLRNKSTATPFLDGTKRGTTITMSLRVLTAASPALLLATGGIAVAQGVTVDINRISDSGVGEKIGTILVTEGKGVTFKVAVAGLPKGQRRFHVHEKGDCGPGMKDGKMTAGVAAGAHYDPDAKKSHMGPKGTGHKGDLPALTASDKGINQTVTAPRLKLTDIQGRSIVLSFTKAATTTATTRKTVAARVALRRHTQNLTLPCTSPGNQRLAATWQAKPELDLVKP